MWVTEVGRRADWSSAADPFAAFVAAITASSPTVTPLPAADGSAHTAADGFDVDYPSPKEGPIAAGWDRPFTVDGQVQPTADFPRMASPWAHVGFDTWRYDISAGGASLHLDFTALAAVTGAAVPPSSTTSTTSGAGGGSTPSTPTPSSSGGGASAGADPGATVAAPITARPTFTG